MRRIVAIVLVLAVLAGVVANAVDTRLGAPAGARAQAAEGEALCTEEQIANEDSQVIETPPNAEGIARPAQVSDALLYSVVVTLPPDSCVKYHSHKGAITLVVHEGTIDYAYEQIAPGATAQIEAVGPSADPILFEEGETIRLEPGAWVTQDQEVNYTYRNAGAEDAVVAIAGYVSIDNFEEQDEAEGLTDASGFSAAPVIQQATPTTGFYMPPWGPVPGCSSGCKKR
jgi:hypothetical protein